ncbi:uridine diphosphate-N-acetylglucosamine-binding protein YvcK [Pseudonocardia sp.]|uniref:gluconeogenesis factor YvcK family protein n=1 Tax=Pseudonocardia sp. TaxID=60912 RepID=UPI00261B043D|nr:uridine diphosphate-N-acetylglucosamine-binding protein YvcK [Pseudonocardia sp.]
MRVVALGGGHGLHATLSALRELAGRGVADARLTAVVTVADDGGSSGRLRRELGLLPPGDLRMAMAALAAEDPAGRRWATLVQHRFGGTGALAGHAVGNLLLAGLMDTLGDPVAALDAVGDLLGVRGRVLPMCAEPLDIEAEVTGLGPGGPHRIRGQVAVASTPGRVRRVWLHPAEPRACPEAVAAVHDADLLVLGPGSWFTSVLPHLLVPELRDAVLTSRARRVVVLNLAPEPGETAGFSPERHLAVLSEHARELRVDAIVADVAAVPVPDLLLRAAAPMLSPGGRVHLAAVAADPARHDPVALADALGAVAGPGESRDPSSGGAGAAVPGPPAAPGSTPAPDSTVQPGRRSVTWR